MTNILIKDAAQIPVADPIPALSISRVTIPAPERGIPIELRITAPAAGKDIPIILFSHGHGPSLYVPSKDGYGPLVNFYAERGFAVIQPSHLNSKVSGLDPSAPDGPTFARSRPGDMSLILDQLDAIESQAPFIAGRLDRNKVAVVGHSLGGATAGLLLGARYHNPEANVADVDLSDKRIKLGVLLGAPGNGFESLTEVARKKFSSALHTDWTHLATRTLVVVGDEDESAWTIGDGADWHRDSYRCGPGADYLLTLHGGKHGFGGVAGWDAKETDDEDPERLAVTQRLTWAYIRSGLYPEDPAWKVACQALEVVASKHGHVEAKS
ncbi:hypothetical protein PFICI_03306 [Pestalotiopsis fici W106-1]|uniref:1-alkyl-2-acetylglycerophosphocholine esterase n=1 Tax=Pestalotiopsis fici (strain W106-1 / CGMCC3.15140) TaxID=1229662 RepID=W3XJA3_PESFW|nr:uncharacterized protein PFICI_03306 [Pestalotiopsis fici W106-1]ETS85281.1 hypothetical protein PFICI_03306 [Pestalotiopsis fici W106-1]